MASPVVFKLRVIDPLSRNAPLRNRAHIFYIAKRIGASLNEGLSHGLTGKIGDNEFGVIKNIKENADYIKQKTDDGTIMYRGIISLAEEDAIRLGYDSKEAWERLIQENIFDIAEKTGVPASRLEYVAAVHMDKGHPHIHFMFWDKEQGVKKAFIHPKVSNQIRIDLTKHIYRDELEELYQLKNNARDVLSGDSDKFFKDFFEYIMKMSHKEYRQAMEELKNNPENAAGYFMNNRLSPAYLETFADKIFAFKEKLPKTGRINYQLLPPELKSELEDIITELIATNEDFSREFDNYVNTSETIASYYSKNPESLAKARQYIKNYY